MAAGCKEIAEELLPLLRVYTDGSIERLLASPRVEPSQDPENSVLSKDVVISRNPHISARVFLPRETKPGQKLPLLVYFHGGGFCIESAFSTLYHRYVESVVNRAQVLAVSVEYRLAPEHLIPAAYDDSWQAINWVSSHSIKGGLEKEIWLSDHGDFTRLFIGGDSAGGNIVHNILVRTADEKLHGDVEIFGALLAHPYFLSSEAMENKRLDGGDEDLMHRIWTFVSARRLGVDDPRISPRRRDMERLACSRMLVCVAEKDVLRDRGVWYHGVVSGGACKGDAQLVDVEGEDHVFHILRPGSQNADVMLSRVCDFLTK